MTSSPDIDLAFNLQDQAKVTIVEKTSYSLPQNIVNSLFDEDAETISADLIMMLACLR